MSTPDDASGDEATSKLTRDERKKSAEAFSSLAEEIANTKGSAAQLPDPPFDGGLRQAIHEARTLSKSARSRQIRRLAKLLEAAAPLKEFRAALEGRGPAILAQQAQERINENWRTRLMEGGDSALGEFVREHPNADRTRLRNLVRQAVRVPADSKSKKAATNLIREIRSVFVGVVPDR